MKLPLLVVMSLLVAGTNSMAQTEAEQMPIEIEKGEMAPFNGWLLPDHHYGVILQDGEWAKHLEVALDDCHNARDEQAHHEKPGGHGYTILALVLGFGLGRIF